MIEAKLLPHPATPPLSVRVIAVTIWRHGGRLHVRYLLDGKSKLVLPGPAEPGRADRLWESSCFEAFVSCGAHAYREYNFSPSGQWAAYDFDGPREGMRNAEAEIELSLEGGEDWIAVEAAVECDKTGSPLGLSAVISEEGGHKSYWALAHSGGPPDFHDPSCFIARLPE